MNGIEKQQNNIGTRQVKSIIFRIIIIAVCFMAGTGFSVVVAQEKTLTIVPDFPDLIVGETVCFPIKIDNLMGKDLEGDIEVRIFEASTQRELKQIIGDFIIFPVKDLEVKTDQTIELDWTFKVPGVEDIQCVITMKTYDGEYFRQQWVLPILSND
jgi:hypothetical protein